MSRQGGSLSSHARARTATMKGTKKGQSAAYPGPSLLGPCLGLSGCCAGAAALSPPAPPGGLEPPPWPPAALALRSCSDPGSGCAKIASASSLADNCRPDATAPASVSQPPVGTPAAARPGLLASLRPGLLTNPAGHTPPGLPHGPVPIDDVVAPPPPNPLLLSVGTANVSPPPAPASTPAWLLTTVAVTVDGALANALCRVLPVDRPACMRHGDEGDDAGRAVLPSLSMPRTCRSRCRRARRISSALPSACAACSSSALRRCCAADSSAAALLRRADASACCAALSCNDASADIR